MRTQQDLERTLSRIDRKGYKAYKDIEGAYRFPDCLVLIDHVQGDPFAAPSRVRVRIDQQVARFDPALFGNRIREVACRDFLSRCFIAAARRFAKGHRGSGKGGSIAMARPGQEILERTSVLIDERQVEGRFTVGLPAYGRRIAGREAAEMLLEELPRIVAASLVAGGVDMSELVRQVDTAEDCETIRHTLPELGCVAFVPDGAILPRRSGIDQRPLTGPEVVAFGAPDSLRVEIDTPHHGTISGMGIPRGVTLIVGGGYHGKSTLLSALEAGVYNHIPGDGRELVATNPATVKIRSEEGRRIEKVCITPFISHLPQGKDTDSFSSDNASGSTSQAANIIEALEVGAKVFLIDEDTSATNFMIRDQRMQKLVAKEHEPITPFIDRVRQLYEEHGVSTVLVIGGAGDYFDVADHVIGMRDYLPGNVTDEAKAVARELPVDRMPEGGASFGSVVSRVPVGHSLDPSKGRRAVKIAQRGIDTIQFGLSDIDLSAVSQIVDTAQTRAIGDALVVAKTMMGAGKTVQEIADVIEERMAREGLAGLYSIPSGGYAAFRRFELAAALNRLRTLAVAPVNRDEH
jgi:predicted ABC-class ATPase